MINLIVACGSIPCVFLNNNLILFDSALSSPLVEVLRHYHFIYVNIVIKKCSSVVILLIAKVCFEYTLGIFHHQILLINVDTGM